MGHYGSEMDSRWGWTDADYARERNQNESDRRVLQFVAADLLAVAAGTARELSRPVASVAVESLQLGQEHRGFWGISPNQFLDAAARFEGVTLTDADAPPLPFSVREHFNVGWSRWTEHAVRYRMSVIDGQEVLEEVKTSAHRFMDLPHVPLRWLKPALGSDIDLTDEFVSKDAGEVNAHLSVLHKKFGNCVVTASGDNMHLMGVAPDMRDRGMYYVIGVNGRAKLTAHTFYAHDYPEYISAVRPIE